MRINRKQLRSLIESRIFNEVLDAREFDLKMTPAIQSFFEKNMTRIDSVKPGFGHVTGNSLAVAAVKLQEGGIDEALIIAALEAMLNKMSQPQPTLDTGKIDPNIVTY